MSYSSTRNLALRPAARPRVSRVPLSRSLNHMELVHRSQQNHGGSKKLLSGGRRRVMMVVPMALQGTRLCKTRSKNLERLARQCYNSVGAVDDCCSSSLTNGLARVEHHMLQNLSSNTNIKIQRSTVPASLNIDTCSHQDNYPVAIKLARIKEDGIQVPTSSVRLVHLRNLSF
jgi:hypothetical protein